MPLNGSGTYEPPAPEFPAVAGTLIRSEDFNAIIQDLADALSNALFRDGQAANEADQDWGGKKLKNLASGTADSDAVNFGQVFKNATFQATSVSGIAFTGTKLTLSLTLVDLSGSTTVTLPAGTSIGSVTSTEIGYLDGVTSSIQTQLNTLATSISDGDASLAASIANLFSAMSAALLLKADKSGGNTFSGLQIMQANLLDGSTAVTQPSTDSSTKVATTAHVASVAMSAALPAIPGNANKLISNDGTSAGWYSRESIINQLPLLALGVI